MSGEFKPLERSHQDELKHDTGESSENENE